MASPKPKQPSDGTWTFVSPDGELEEVDDSSSSSSSEFVKLGGDVVSYHHLAQNSDSTSDSELSISSDEGRYDKASNPTSLVPVNTPGTATQQDISTKREESPLSDISDASLLDDQSSAASILSAGVSSSSSCSAEMVGAETTEADSDVEIISNENGEKSKNPCTSKPAPSGDTPDENFEVSKSSSTTDSAPPSSSLEEVQEPCLSRQTSNDSSVQLRLVLRQRSVSTSDSDSDFSHLESHSNVDQSESDAFLQTENDEALAPSVGEGFRFVEEAQQGPVAESSKEGTGSQDLSDEGHGDAEQEGTIQVCAVEEANIAAVGDNAATDGQGSNDLHQAGDNQGAVVQEIQDINFVGGGGQVAEEVVDPFFGDAQEVDIIQGVDEVPIIADILESNEDDLDAATESGAEDDRIESDQSEGLPADDDDLSFSNIGLENISLHEPNGRRLYCHEPNKYLSGTLSLVVIMAGWLALGLGIGHSLGSARPNAYLNQAITHANKIHEVHDSLLLCQRRKTDIHSALVRERLSQDQREETLKQIIVSQGNFAQQLNQEIESWKVKVNDLEQQKADLMIENGRLKYNRHPANLEKDGLKDSHHPANPESDGLSDSYRPAIPESDGLINSHRPANLESDDPNRGFGSNLQRSKMKNSRGSKMEIKTGVLTPKEDLDKITNPIVRLQDDIYPEIEEPGFDSSNDSSDDLEAKPQTIQEWENQTEKLKEELNLARGRADMWQLLYLTERQRKTPRINVTPDALSCLALLTPKINFSEIVKVVNKTIVTGIEKLPNVTQIKSFINQSLETQDLFRVSEVHAFLEELGNLWLKLKSTKPEDASPESHVEDEDISYQQEGEDVEDENLYQHDDKNGQHDKRQEYNSDVPRWSKTIQDFLNETQQSVSRVSKEIQEQWKVVRNFSQKMWKKQRQKMEKFHSRVVDKVSGITFFKSRSWFGLKTKKQNKKQKKAAKKALRNIFQELKSFAAYKDKRFDSEDSAAILGRIQQFHKKYGSYYPNKKAKARVKCQIQWWTLNTGRRLQEFPCKCAQYVYRWQSKQAKKAKKRHSEKQRGDNKPGKDKRQSEQWKKQKRQKKSEQDYKKPKGQQKEKDLEKNSRGTLGGTKRRGDKKQHGLKFDHRHQKKETRHDTGSCKDSKTRHRSHCGRSHDEHQHHHQRHSHAHDRHSRHEKHHDNREERHNLWHHSRTEGEHEKVRKHDQQKHAWESGEPHNSTGEDSSTSGPDKVKSRDDTLYVRKMQDQRKLRESGEWNSDNSNWLFARAEDRDFHRNKPDNWFFRRGDGRHKGKYFESEKKYRKEKLHDDDYDHDYDDYQYEHHENEEHRYFNCFDTFGCF